MNCSGHFRLCNQKIERLTAAYGVGILYLGYLICNVSIGKTHLNNGVIFVLKNVADTTVNINVQYTTNNTKILSQIPDVQKYLRFKEPKNDLKAPEITNMSVWLTGMKINHFPANSIVNLSVKYGSAGRIDEERTVIFEPNRDLEHRVLILSFCFEHIQKRFI